MTKHKCNDLPDLASIAESIGGAILGTRAAGDFSFLAVMRGKTYRATCRYIAPDVADIIPASRY